MKNLKQFYHEAHEAHEVITKKQDYIPVVLRDLRELRVEKLLLPDCPG
jgi:hypothetical protein